MTPRAIGLALLGGAIFAQASPLTRAAQATPKVSSAPPISVVQIGVDVVQLDAVITDKKGMPIRDLKPEDFSIEIDGKKQPISNAAFFDATPSAIAGVADPGTTTAAPSVEPRTIVFVVDDLNISFESMYKAKHALKAFSAAWDAREARVGLRSTSDEGETFTVSRSPQKFMDSVAAVRYGMLSDKGLSSTPSYTRSYSQTSGSVRRFDLASGNSFQDQSRITPISGTYSDLSSPANPAVQQGNYGQRIYSLMTTINSLRSLPGRKAVVILSEGFSVGNDRNKLGINSPFDSLFDDNDSNAALRMITEVANRASVVLYTIDPRGLAIDSPGADSDLTGEQALAVGQSNWFSRVSNQGTLNELAGSTGGLSFVNRNDLRVGLNDVVRDQRAYYLIGFEPPKSAFQLSSGKPKFHKIKLTVNRPDVQVRTRSGFYGITDREVIERAPLMVAAPPES